MTSQSRKHRGMRTQHLTAQYLQTRGWPYAESTGASRQGVDITGTPDLAIEVKARTDLNPVAWIRQAETHATHQRLPLVIYRANGIGENPDNYIAMIRLGDLMPLLHAAGYGDPHLQEPA